MHGFQRPEGHRHTKHKDPENAGDPGGSGRRAEGEPQAEAPHNRGAGPEESRRPAVHKADGCGERREHLRGKGVRRRGKGAGQCGAYQVPQPVRHRVGRVFPVRRTGFPDEMARDPHALLRDPGEGQRRRLG